MSNVYFNNLSIHDNNKNTLKGVVTPENQTTKKFSKDKLELKEIVTKEDILSKFELFTFPDFFIMESGEMFMDAKKKIISNIHDIRVKWFILNEKFEISHDHDYPYVSVPETGYLMRISIPITSIENHEFVIDYIVDINNVEFKFNDLIQNNEDNINDKLRIPDFDTIKCNINFEVLYNKLFADKDTFFNEYLSDIIKC